MLGLSLPPGQPAGEPPPSNGKFLGWFNAVKGLTITNAVVIILLVLVAIPAYLVYRAVNDEHLLDRFLSNYTEISGQQSPCTVRAAQTKGGPRTWGISTGFAYSGTDRYLVSVVLDHPLRDGELESYCETLNLIVDFMRDPDGESPPFPGTDEPVVRQYERRDASAEER